MSLDGCKWGKNPKNMGKFMGEVRITDQDIEALVDNQLDKADAARVTYALLQNPRLHRKYSQLLTQKRLLQLWWQHDGQAAHS